MCFPRQQPFLFAAHYLFELLANASQRFVANRKKKFEYVRDLERAVGAVLEHSAFRVLERAAALNARTGQKHRDLRRAPALRCALCVFTQERRGNGGGTAGERRGNGGGTARTAGELRMLLEASLWGQAFRKAPSARRYQGSSRGTLEQVKRKKGIIFMHYRKIAMLPLFGMVKVVIAV